MPWKIRLCFVCIVICALKRFGKDLISSQGCLSFSIQIASSSSWTHQHPGNPRVGHGVIALAVENGFPLPRVLQNVVGARPDAEGAVVRHIQSTASPGAPVG